MGSRYTLLSSAAGILLVFNAAAAEMTEQEPSDLTTDELVISTTRTLESIQRSAAAVTVLTQEQILS
jgi:outer membrane cobalamin receptor